MNTPLSWIRAYVPGLDCTDQEYTDAMTLSGTKVENFTRLDKNLEKIVVGQILEINPHPDADKLIICKVLVGADNAAENAIEGAPDCIQIVTGAHNAVVGDKVAVVLDGGKVAGGHDGGPLPEDGIKIKKGKLRGVPSYGMMCSIEELGSSKDYYPEAPDDGLYIFPEDAVVGSDAIEALGLHDTIVEYEITSNRVDCYSILGIAREAAATFGREFVAPHPIMKGNSEKASDYVRVSVEDKDLCTRYIARVVKNVKVGPSPRWMQRHLAAAGIRPINNLVDITNYVMREYGQPMHAFDLDTVAGGQIIVKRAKDGEEFITLDGQTRKLDKDILMICDGEKEIGIAGIMGGQNSMITEHVHTLLFEAACFNGTNIRLSAKRLGMRTDASGIFEKGLDANVTYEAMNRACELIEQLGCGEVVGGSVDVYDKLPETRTIAIRPDWINGFLGTNISKEDMFRYLRKIELTVDEKAMTVTCPSWRQDLEQEADIAEEVARFFGYANIPTTLPHGEATAGKISHKMRVEKLAGTVARFSGFSEAKTFSFESPKVYDKLKIAADSPLRQTIVVSNPLGEDYSIMRTLPLDGMLSSLASNYNHRNKNVKLYELAKIYIPSGKKAENPRCNKDYACELPDERVEFTLGFYGEGDFFFLKGIVEEILQKAGIKEKASYDPKAELPFFHPGRKAQILLGDRAIGYMGEIHPDVADAYDLGERTYIAVIDMPAIMDLTTFDKKYEGIARFPAVTRDISMLMSKDILAGQVEEVIRKRGGKLLENCELFDIYEGSQIGLGFKSMAYALSFRAKDHTLSDDEVNAVMKKILNGLAELKIELRS